MCMEVLVAAEVVVAAERQVQACPRPLRQIPLFSEDEVNEATAMLCKSLKFDKTSVQTIPERQPIRLSLLSHLAHLRNDIDKHLPDLLASGVPTGILEPLPSSYQWPLDRKLPQRGLESG